MDNWTRKIRYSEYDSAIFKNKSIRKIHRSIPKVIGDIDISFFQLCVSTAKSILTRAHYYSPEVSAFARGYLMTIPLLLSEKNGFLALNNDNKDILRDFSKSTRHGELAQGINYFFAMDHLKAYAVYDFGYFSNIYKNIRQKCRGKTPDYVLCYPAGSIGIIESKGTAAADPTRCLISGHGQCRNGETFLRNHGIRIADSYVSAVSFATSSPYMKRDTHIYYADPSYEMHDEEENMEKHRLYEYSKWFYFAGNKSATEKLMTGQRLSGGDYEPFRVMRSQDKIIINSLEIETGERQGRVRINLGISFSLEEFLSTGNLDILKENEKYTTDFSEMFGDGTFIEIEA